MDKCAECGHEERYHAKPDTHNLGTSHCTKGICECKEYKGK